MARDWTKAFRRASFRGVPFHVEVEEGQGGRRLAVMPIAGSETVVVEDMGRIPRLYPVTAYVAGEAADSEALALTAALDLPDAGLLVLPMEAPQLASVLEWHRSRERDVNGWIAFEVAFHEPAGVAAGFALVSGFGPIDGLLSAAVPVIAGAAARLAA